MRLIYLILWLTLCHLFILKHLFSSVFTSQPFTQSQPDWTECLTFQLLSRLIAHCPPCLFLTCLSLFSLSKSPNFLPEFVSACSLPFSCLPISWSLIPSLCRLYELDCLPGKMILWIISCLDLPFIVRQSILHFQNIIFNEILSSITTVLCCIRNLSSTVSVTKHLNIFW